MVHNFSEWDSAFLSTFHGIYPFTATQKHKKHSDIIVKSHKQDHVHSKTENDLGNETADERKPEVAENGCIRHALAGGALVFSRMPRKTKEWNEEDIAEHKRRPTRTQRVRHADRTPKKRAQRLTGNKGGFQLLLPRAE